MAFLPVTREECARLGWDAPDFIFVVGEAYVDHPSFGQAIISRVLENAGYHVAMLCLPDFHNAEDFQRFGRPKLGFLVTAGVIDSMVNHYTVAKKRRNTDAYAPGGQPGLRPDRATTVYCNRIHQAYPGVPVLIGGVEASLRRFSHYDYWDDKVRRSLLVDAAATLLMFGMGEHTVLTCADWVRRGMPEDELPAMRGCCYMAREAPADAVLLPAHAQVTADPAAYARAFMLEYQEQDAISGHRLCQQQDTLRFVVQNLPALPLTREELDTVYALPYERTSHPMYDPRGGVPALQEVRFSISAERGCFGSCSFCSITFHQGRVVTSRSEESIVQEAQTLTELPDFKGYIHDIGGPTANFREAACSRQLKTGCCRDRQCLYPTPCKNLRVSHAELVRILRRVRSLPRVKKVFIRSGIRFDYLMADRDPTFFRELCAYHISGQLKVAPEHISPAVLDKMGKPRREVYDAFVRKYEEINRSLNLKQYLVPYLMSSHPGCSLADAVTLAEYLRDTGHQPEQVQDFYPTPGTLSTCMYYTGLDPRTMEPVYVPRAPREKAMQRALMQWRNPANHGLIREALRLCGREDLIGFGRDCLVPPRNIRSASTSGWDDGHRRYSGKDRTSTGLTARSQASPRNKERSYNDSGIANTPRASKHATTAPGRDRSSERGTPGYGTGADRPAARDNAGNSSRRNASARANVQSKPDDFGGSHSTPRAQSGRQPSHASAPARNRNSSAVSGKGNRGKRHS